MKVKITANDLNQTKDLANVFAKTLKTPMIVVLSGDLGAGKTTFVREVVRALGGEDEVTSPTFTLLNIYQAQFPIYHFDMYRLSSAEDAMNVGFEEYFDKNTLNGVCFVEWAENVEGLIKEVDFEVEILKEGEKSRTFIIKEGADVASN